MTSIQTNIDLWVAHLTRNPQEIIEVVAVLAATHPALEIEEDEEETTPQGNQVSEQDATKEDSNGGGS